MAPISAYPRSYLEELLTSALGLPKAREVVADTLAALQISDEQLDLPGARRVLEHVSRADGLVGVAGRVALTRLQGRRAAPGTMRRPSPKRSLVVVAGLLAPTLGEERADVLVRDLAKTLALGEEIDLEQALALLERVAQMPGVTGIAARFAKTRIHLSW